MPDQDRQKPPARGFVHSSSAATMTPERYQRACAVFDEVLGQAPEQRSEYLATACGHDDELRADVQNLFEGQQAADRDGFLDVPSFVIDAIPLELPDFGDYESIEYLGHGGMGVVYRARHTGLDCQVALKMSLPRHLTTSEDVERFRAEAKSMARLQHPNIVRVHEIEEHEGRPFFRMEFVEGTSLDRRADDFGRDPSVVAALVATLARAVHHAHLRGVLHRDLKPQNVLIDVENTPYIMDFGLARRLGQDVEVTAAGLHHPDTGETLDSGSSAYRGIVGTAGFMSPENADPECEETILSDVYGLGAILYAVLTGRPPARGRSFDETTRWVRDPEQRPITPRDINPRVDSDLEAICLKCLDKIPERRYDSAAELAEDLDRWHKGLETRARPWNPMLRALRWCHRQPATAALLATALIATVLAGVIWIQSDKYEAQQTARRHELLSSTGHVARLVAATVRDRLDEFARTVEQESHRPEIAAILVENNGPRLREHIAKVANRHHGTGRASQFEAWAIFAPNGTMIAHSLDSDHVGAKFDFRDYFRGAIGKKLDAGDDAVHVSRVYESKVQDLFKFGLTSTIRDTDDRIVGVLLATLTTDRTMSLPHTVDSRYIPVLVAPHEAPGEAEESWVILFHPAYEHGDDPVPFPAKLAAGFKISPLTEDYRDPIGEHDPWFDGRWYAGAAPVPGTGFFVVVQVRVE